MSRSVLRVVILLSLLVSGTMCQPEHVSPSTLTGKIVIDKACNNVVIQLLQGTIEPARLDPMWKDTLNDSTYINVFTVANRCTFPNNFLQGDSISFQLDDNPPVQTCYVCFFYYPVPPITNSVKDVQLVKKTTTH